MINWPNVGSASPAAVDEAEARILVDIYRRYLALKSCGCPKELAVSKANVL
jgi:hypothetical protein